MSWTLSKDPAEMVKHLVYEKTPTGPMERSRKLVAEPVFRSFVEASRGCYGMTMNPYSSWSQFAEEVAQKGDTFFSNAPTHDPEALVDLLREVVGSPFTSTTLSAG